MDHQEKGPAEVPTSDGLQEDIHQQADHRSSANEREAESAAPVVCDIAEAKRFLEILRKDGPWALSAVLPDRTGFETETINDLTVAGAWIQTRNASKNVYVGINPPIKSLNKKAKKEDIRGAQFLHVDCDPRAGEDLISERKRILGALEAYTPPPSIIVDSGGGYWGLWKLDAEFRTDGDEDKVAELEAYNLQIELTLNADACFNIDRIMRLPGTVNWPNGTKIKKGQVPVVARIIQHRADQVYSLGQMKPAARTVGTATAAPEVKLSSNLPKVDLDALPEGVSSRIKMLIVQGTDPDEPNKYGSRSELVFAAVCGLVRAGVSDDAIASILLDQDFRISDHVREQPKPRDYAVRQIKRAKEEVRKGSSPYRIVNGALCSMRQGEEGRFAVPLCNFAPRIEEERKIDDGVATAIHVRIAGTLDDGSPLPTITLPVEEINGQWWFDKWGVDAVAVVTANVEAHIRAGMQTLSKPVPKRTVYTHTGWRKLDGQWLYLHAGGAIGAQGVVDGYEVELDGELSHFSLPAPVDLISAVQASLKLLDLGPIGVALAAATYRAPLGEFCPIDCSLALVGDSGVFKSAQAALAQCHWGTRWWKGREFAANWSATANSLEKKAYILKDVLLIVDDFAPKESAQEAIKQQQTAERLYRGVGNQGGRGRMNADGSLRQTFWPRGMIVSTGEDAPKGYSLNARTFTLEAKKDQVDRAKLSALQAAARDGVLAQSMAAFIKWLAPQADELPERLAAKCLNLRDQIYADHARTPDNVASLLLGLEALLTFASEVGAITEAEAKELWESRREDLIAHASGQDLQQETEKPAEKFRRMIGAALSAGRAHLCARHNGPPEDRIAESGWRWNEFKGGWEPRADCIGFLQDDDLWLIPEAAYACAESLARQQNSTLGITSKTLGERLDEAGWIKSREEDRYTKKLPTKKAKGDKSVKESPRRVYHLSVASFLPSLLPAQTKPATGPLPPEPDHEQFERQEPPIRKPSG